MYQNECSKNSKPFYKRWSGRLKAFTKKQPKLTISIMLAFATLNFLLMVYVVNSRPAKSIFPKDLAKNVSFKGQRQSVSYNIGNYLKISKLKDSLDYLMRVPKLTRSDSLLFIRICNEYSRLDPSFSRSINQALNQKIKKP